MTKFKTRLKAVDPEIKNSIEKSDQVAQFIVEKLKEKNWSKGRLAQEMGDKSQSLVTRYLTGQHNFTFSTISKLETALGCKILSVNNPQNIFESSFDRSDIGEHLNKWYEDTPKKEYFKIVRNFSGDKEDYNYSHLATKKKQLAS